MFAATGPAVLLLVVAFAVAGLLYTVASPTVAVSYLAAWMLIALIVLGWAYRARPRRTVTQPSNYT